MRLTKPASLISLLLLLPSIGLIGGGLFLTYVLQNIPLRDSFYSLKLFAFPDPQFWVVWAPFAAMLLAGLPVLWQAYVEGGRHLFSEKTLESVIDRKNWWPLLLVFLAAGIVSFTTLHDSLRCFAGLPTNGWDAFVSCIQSS